LLVGLICMLLSALKKLFLKKIDTTGNVAKAVNMNTSTKKLDYKRNLRKKGRLAKR